MGIWPRQSKRRRTRLTSSSRPKELEQRRKRTSRQPNAPNAHPPLLPPPKPPPPNPNPSPSPERPNQPPPLPPPASSTIKPKPAARSTKPLADTNTTISSEGFEGVIVAEEGDMADHMADEVDWEALVDRVVTVEKMKDDEAEDVDEDEARLWVYLALKDGSQHKVRIANAKKRCPGALIDFFVIHLRFVPSSSLFFPCSLRPFYLT
jgi:hypothetical protein